MFYVKSIYNDNNELNANMSLRAFFAWSFWHPLKKSKQRVY